MDEGRRWQDGVPAGRRQACGTAPSIADALPHGSLPSSPALRRGGRGEPTAGWHELELGGRRPVVGHSCGGPARGGRPTEAPSLAAAGTAPPPCVPSPSRPPLPEQQRSAGGRMAWRRWRLGSAPRGGGPLSSQAASHGGSARSTPGRRRQSASPGRPRPGGRRTRGGGRWRARRWREVGDPGDVEE